jgi:hypothetical protein
MAMDVDALAAAAFEGVPGARLAGVLDMQTAFFLALEAGACRTEEADALAASAREVFDGPLTAGLRRTLVPAGRAQRLEEVLVVGQETVFLFARISAETETALVLACDRETNLGIMLTRARQLARGS